MRKDIYLLKIVYKTQFVTISPDYVVCMVVDDNIERGTERVCHQLMKIYSSDPMGPMINREFHTGTYTEQFYKSFAKDRYKIVVEKWNPVDIEVAKATFKSIIPEHRA